LVLMKIKIDVQRGDEAASLFWEHSVERWSRLIAG
jgi:hypothetical protein